MTVVRPAGWLILVWVCMLACHRPPDDPGRVDPPEIREAFRFTKALTPVAFDPDAEATRAGEQHVADSASCADCHRTIYDNWHGSRHRVAFTNPLYKEAHAREPSRWCVNCHAPFVHADDAHRYDPEPFQAADGISCVVCHVRDGKMLTGRVPEAPANGDGFAHDYHIVPAMSQPEFCGSCHQFNFLSAASVDATRQWAAAIAHARSRGEEPPPVDQAPSFAYSDLVMQNTVGEWKSSSYGTGGSLGCHNCHLRPGGPESHTFPGGHDLAGLARSIGIEARHEGGGRLELRVYTVGIGHAFPTGDLFRALRVKLYTPGGRPVREIVLKKRYANIPREERDDDPLRPPKRLVEDGVIPPPVAGDFVSSRTLSLAWPREARDELRYELYIDYLEPSNHLLTHLPLSLTSPRFKSGVLRIYPEDEPFLY